MDAYVEASLQTPSERAKVAALSSAHGARAVVTAATQLSANVGLSLIARGGNVFDAAVGAALAETVLLPPKCGLAGDLVALVLRAGEHVPTALLSIGPAPEGLAERAGSHGLPTTGAWSVGMPGAPAGYASISDMGVLGRREQAAPAIELARAGFPWPGVAAALTQQAQQLLTAENPDGVPYLPDGVPVAAGSSVRAPGLATVLEEFVERGDQVLAGPVGRAIVEALDRRGRSVRTEDLLSARVEHAPAAERSIQGRRVWATPSPTHGPWLLEAIAEWAPQRGAQALFDAVERTVERRRRALHDDRHAGTSVVTAADAAGNAIVIVHSNSYQRYGSGIVVAPYGLVLSNRAGRGFSSDQDHPNFCVPGRRPATTLHAWAIEHEDGEGVRLMGATPGGENQMRWNAQVIADVLDGGVESPGQLVAAPRWGRFDDIVRVEESHGLARSGLSGDGFRTDHVPDFSLRSSQQVLALGVVGSVVAGADPRTEAAARSW
jgi:gamma-glutamyltranspeptidase/glutathione hydrolase